MNTRLLALIRRRERLLARAEAQRAEIAASLRQWRVPLLAADRGLDAVRLLKAHPALLAPPLAVLLVLRPRRFANWSAKAWVVWRFWRTSPLVEWFRHAQ